MRQQNIHFVLRPSGMSLLETRRVPPPSAGKDTALHDWVRALAATAPIADNPRRILPGVIAEVAHDRGDATALVSTRETLSFRALAARANRYARWALAQDLDKGAAVALFMPNRPEYVAIWLGITATGGVVSLLNTHLRDASLAHCIDIVAPKHIIVAAELVDAFRSAQPLLRTQPKIWSHEAGDHGRIDRDLDKFSDAPLSAAERRDTGIADRALHIYTSGTTGLPKAAHVSHHRLLQWSYWFGGLLDTGPDDRMYDCLPMYHSVGGVVAIGALLVNGGSAAIRDKFSAQSFWDDVIRWDCTLFQYIGELCRYLLNAPPRPLPPHRLRLACGNGLNADVWQTFQQRFRIPRILEFYAATEGNVSLYNVEGKVGAIGRVPAFLSHRFPLALVKFDRESNTPIRDADGFCIRCATDEAGEAIGRIRGGAGRAGGRHTGGEFEGYTDADASEKKIIRDVFERGDAWYRTGDLMRRDVSGFFYFVDRVGDTFRWKGENVATSEVAAAIMAFPGIVEAAVYGVGVPGAEGTAGMAAIVVDGALDLVAFWKHLACRLPAYARPLFLRIRDRLDVTATFKQKKSDLVRDGFDPVATRDVIYFADPAQKRFVRVDRPLFGRIRSGAIRL
jgi:fatty-acyl-CoA synthase